MRVLLDTNILLRLGNQGHSLHSTAAQAVELLEARRCDCTIVPQVLYEYWVVGTRPAEQNGFGIDAVVADAAMTAWLRRFLLLPDEQGIFSHWRSLVLGHAVKGKAAHDARLVASMLHHGVKNIVSTPIVHSTSDSSIGLFGDWQYCVPVAGSSRHLFHCGGSRRCYSRQF